MASTFSIECVTKKTLFGRSRHFLRLRNNQNGEIVMSGEVQSNALDVTKTAMNIARPLAISVIVKQVGE